MASPTHEIGDGSSWRPSEQVSPTPSPSPPSIQMYDLLCIGFGPASLAIAIALADRSSTAKVSFLERQPEFAWHAGMQLSGAKMQISFLKDLATPRNPKSHFTFVNYLFSKKRLNTFINLDTFTPSRLEYEDYLRWCAGHFDEQVAYGQEVVSVEPDTGTGSGTPAGHGAREEDGHDGHGAKGSLARPGEAKAQVTRFRVISRDLVTGKLTTRTARHVVIAVGGRGTIPAELPQSHPRVVHSSKYSQQVRAALPLPAAAYHIAVVGNGQSAAEIFNDLPARYPHARVTMVIRGTALRPSDDSPFVNEIFDPDRVDGVFAEESTLRATRIRADRATNYGVVRLTLLEHLYEKLYMQRLKNEDPSSGPLRIRTSRRVAKAVERDGKLVLSLGTVREREGGELRDWEQPPEEELSVDAVFVATGYERNAHESLLVNTRALLSAQDRKGGATAFPVRRDYKIAFDESKVAANAGVWLQGCNEKTHGVSLLSPPHPTSLLMSSSIVQYDTYTDNEKYLQLSDTLLSILAVRGGELVQSIFGPVVAEHCVRAKL
ncbi:unnamed protein product [Diplocarpon coronariae]|uniref:L-ornithine N(5)-monooxygenase [NAD(P)H] n=1 Tax=Diplocarpon coronariae TaxID=2795749 RepID=A0A218ZGF7_9HELO|nr:L-ornithine N5-oxygenase SidA [Marssonina coronariae]